MYAIAVIDVIFSCYWASSFQEFIDPPIDSRPVASWWWNGNRIAKNELSRELDVLKKAWIGGVEINPIALPEGVSDDKSKPVVWLSKEWNEMVRYAAEETKARDMVVDLLVGTGWPFGGEFLTEDQVIERAIVHRLPCKGGDRVNESFTGLYDQAIAAIPRPQKEAVDDYELLFIRLVPVDIELITDQIDLTDQFKTAGDTLTYTIPEGRYELIYGILQKRVSESRPRCRYDYNRLLVNTFLKNFVQVFQQYCSDNIPTR